VKTIEEVRHANLLSLIKGYPTIQAFAAAIGKDAAQVGQWKNKNTRPNGTTYQLDSGTARCIDERLTLARGWMDNDHDAWPFQSVDLDKVQSLHRDDRLKLEGMLVLMAHQIGLDVANQRAA
jgi:hypothetical protein